MIKQAMGEWLTPIQAADQLSVSLAQRYTAADVLQLGLNNRLVLSVRFLSPVSLLLRNTATIVGKPDKGARPRHVGQRRTTTSAEIWDLTWVGSEYATVEALRQSLTGHGIRIPPHLPAYVRSRDGDVWEVPSPGLLHDCEIVVRRDQLAALEIAEGAPPEGQKADLGTRRERTLLMVIAAACNADKVDLAARGAGKSVVGSADLLGLKIGASTIYEILNEVREVVGDASRSQHNSR